MSVRDRLRDRARKFRAFVRIDPRDLRRAGGDGPAHAAVHRRIVRAGAAGLALGVVVGLALCAALLLPALAGNGPMALPTGYLGMVFGYGLSGMAAGVSAALAVAPRAFLLGPLGRKWWFGLGGPRNVPLGRLVSVLLALLLGAYVVGGGVAAVVLLAR
jgi:hypothetical protein